jgi:Uma2 family endonuclease
VYPAPTDVVFSDDTVVEPDVVALSADAARHLVNPAHVDVTPTLVVEVSSPSTRRLDLIAKRALYEREGVPVYWFVDLDADRVDVHVLHEGRYGAPVSVDGDERLRLDVAPGLTLPVADVLAG